MDEKANSDIRRAARNAGVRLWEVANKLGLNDGNFSRKLRTELSADEKEKILGIIGDLAVQKGVAS